jgi:hypothetical protein
MHLSTHDIHNNNNHLSHWASTAASPPAHRAPCIFASSSRQDCIISPSSQHHRCFVDKHVPAPTRPRPQLPSSCSRRGRTRAKSSSRSAVPIFRTCTRQVTCHCPIDVHSQYPRIVVLLRDMKCARRADPRHHSDPRIERCQPEIRCAT